MARVHEVPQHRKYLKQKVLKTDNINFIVCTLNAEKIKSFDYYKTVKDKKL